jgi:monovalent cation:proton antiporter
MLVVATRVMMPMAVMVGVYIFLRGHNEPGGGFIAGLVVAIALLMQYMASGFAWAQDRQRVQYHTMIAWGVLAAALTGVGSWLADRPFLTSNFGYFRVPPMEEFELATAMLFDVGVFLTVVGAVMLALASLSRIARRAGEEVATQPMDIDPSAADSDAPPPRAVPAPRPRRCADMEALVAISIGTITASGIYLMLRQRTFPVVLGMAMLSYAVNVFLFASGRLTVNQPPVLLEPAPYTDPLPQALVLTAIVIAFGMTAVVVMLALGAFLESGTDKIDMTEDDDEGGAPVNHLILAPVILPAIMAPLIVLAMRHDVSLQRVFSTAATAALVVMSAMLLWQSASGAVQVYELGNWPAPFGIVLVLDRLSALMVGSPTCSRSACCSMPSARAGTPGQAFPRAVPVPAHGHQRRLPDRRRLQPVRVLRGAADRLLRADDPRGRRGAGARGRAIRGLQPRRLDAVPVRARHALRHDRHAEHGRSGRAHRRPARGRSGAGPRGRHAPADRLCGEGGAGADPLLAAQHLQPCAGAGGGAVRDHDQGRRLFDPAHVHDGLSARVGGHRHAVRRLADARGGGHDDRRHGGRAGVEHAGADDLVLPPSARWARC